MTHYDVDYSKLTPQAKYNKAIADIKDYMGEERYNKVIGLFKHRCHLQVFKAILL